MYGIAFLPKDAIKYTEVSGRKRANVFRRYILSFSRIYGKEGLQLRKIEVPTAESEGISDMMPKTFNKKLLNALSDDDDDEVPFVDDEDGDPNWEEF
ncbi:hypothetical protein TNCV_2672351 [Trichonephila clavipes]|nr:hypothetical protein TNCV_2672351 [Trichonephila clavipes]